jgi:phosphatidylserine decarboxylase
LKSKRGDAKRKGSFVSGEIQLQFTLVDPTNQAASPRELLNKLSAFTTSGSEDETLEGAGFSKFESGDLDEDEDEEADLDTSDEPDNLTKPEKAEKQKRRLRLKRLKRKTKARAYELTGGNDCVGIAFIEIGRITDLPPERNSWSF